ncbi:non-ribosomal peptide synthetase [Paenibacillus mucilaginosus]|uniref:Amino acid adenylation n=1 Tax=Paenibacillus mucilaginosus (strain KNP414) TaxID=1036673 RepID=F8F9L3_PAEMK|nr:non-ribosomal peptide synthetase [Paenibacillus mucilaginosus]AEI43702.1 amino acid adenylation [Paenibacillus mucilaginosus KNP414]MCG7216936.1 amino acid adenylation domain-containing protein [Paenibacillus mucilaginosus]
MMNGTVTLERVSRNQPLPLSFDQYRLWFLHQLDPDSIHYNINKAFRFRGPLQHERFESALNRIIARHESLRTVFRFEGQEPCQVIHGELRLSMPITDLRALPEEQREAEAVRLMNAEAEVPFRLDTGPLLRARMYRLGEDDQLILFTIHHIIADFGSLGKIIQELAHFYTAETKGEAGELPPLPVQFADYAYWQKAKMQGEQYHKQLNYWKEKLGGELPVLRMPMDRPRPPVMTYNGDNVQITIPKELTARLGEVSRRNGVTLFMTLLAAYQTLLYRYTGQEDICIGTPISARTQPELQGVIGQLINTLVLRTSLEGEPTFAELLKRTRKTAFGAFAHQDIPFEKLVEELRTERDMSHNLFFQTMLMHLSAPVEDIQLSPDISIEPYEFQKKTSTFELNFTITEQNGEMLGSMDYNTDLYNRATIQRLLGHFRSLLEAVADDPQRSIADLPILEKEERSRIVDVWSGRQAARELPQACIHELFSEQAARTPEAPAVRHRGQMCTYRELEERSNRLAHYLIGRGAGHGKLVGLCMERSIDMVAGLLAILKSGGAYVPIDPSYPEERQKLMLRSSGAELLLTVEAHADRLRKEDCAVIAVDTMREAIESESAVPPVTGVQQDDLMYVIYTSGSTGTPKGVMVSHKGVVNHCAGVTELFGLEAQDRVLQFTSVSFDVAVQEIFPALLAGAELVLWKDAYLTEGGEFLDWIGEQGITVLNLTTAYWNSLVSDLQLGRAGLPQDLRLVIVGGEKVSPETYSAWKQVTGGRVRWINDYGLTETTITAAMFEPEAGWEPGHIVPVGRPLAGMEIYILDGKGQPVPTGVFGELYIGGTGVALGYWGQPELTRERFVPHPLPGATEAKVYKTGDLARFLPDGQVEFLGRLDHQVKIRGYRIELGEVEAALAQYGKLAQAVVLPRKSPAGTTQLAAYIVLSEHTVSIDELKAFLKGRLPDYMVPSHYVVLDHIPLTVNGKVDTAALPQPEQLPSSVREYIAPCTASEETAAAIWGSILGIPNIGVLDSFFEQGGNSLLATQVISQAKSLYGCTIPLRTLFEYPVLADWAEQVDRIRGGERDTERCLVKINRKGSRIPLFLIHPVGGSITCYFTLARQLGEDQPFYALQAHGMVSENSTLDTVEKMADHYIHEIRQIQPHGPYRLGGWSMGGFIAYEIARRLKQEGEEVIQLALIDSYLSKTTEVDAETILYNFIRQLAAGPGKTISDSIMISWKSLNLDHAGMCRELQNLGLLPEGTSPEEVQRLIEVYTTTVKAFKKYMPSPPSKLDIEQVQLFRATDSHEEEGIWTELVTSLSLHHVVADHFSIVHSPEVGRLIDRTQSYSHIV